MAMIIFMMDSLQKTGMKDIPVPDRPVAGAGRVGSNGRTWRRRDILTACCIERRWRELRHVVRLAPQPEETT